MKEYYTSIRNYWDAETFYAKKPEVWIDKAINLWLSAKVLYDQQCQWPSPGGAPPNPYPAFWSYRIVRMLMGFAFENLIKAFLIKVKGKDANWFRKEGNLKIGGKGHDLIWLFGEADLPLEESEKHYLGLCAMYALWAGRYPIAANENDMPRKRESMASSDELLKRSVKMHEKYAKDPRIKYGDYWDLLHVGVGDYEYGCLENVYNRLKEMLV